jgi:hypothetical protein
MQRAARFVGCVEVIALEPGYDANLILGERLQSYGIEKQFVYQNMCTCETMKLYYDGYGQIAMLFTKANTEKLRDSHMFRHVRHSPAPNTPSSCAAIFFTSARVKSHKSGVKFSVKRHVRVFHPYHPRRTCCSYLGRAVSKNGSPHGSFISGIGSWPPFQLFPFSW